MLAIKGLIAALALVGTCFAIGYTIGLFFVRPFCRK